MNSLYDLIDESDLTKSDKLKVKRLTKKILALNAKLWEDVHALDILREDFIRLVSPFKPGDRVKYLGGDNVVGPYIVQDIFITIHNVMMIQCHLPTCKPVRWPTFRFNPSLLRKVEPEVSDAR